MDTFITVMSYFGTFAFGGVTATAVIIVLVFFKKMENGDYPELPPRNKKSKKSTTEIEEPGTPGPIIV